MGIIARIYDFVAGTKIRSADVDAELNQLVSAHNVHDAEIDSLEAGRQLLSEKGMANGYAPLNSSAKIDSIYILDSILGQLEYQGTYNATTDSPTLPSASGVKGHYYIISTGGTVSGVVYNVGDWIVSNGTAWEKVDNTDAVAAVFGRTGTILPATNDYTFAQINKETSSLADLTTRSAADLSSGILPDARMPDLTGDVTTNEGAVATTIAAGAVGTTKLANESVTNPKLGPLSITNDKVANATLTAAKFASGELTNESANGVAITALQAETVTKTESITKSVMPDKPGVKTNSPKLVIVGASNDVIKIAQYNGSKYVFYTFQAVTGDTSSASVGTNFDLIRIRKAILASMVYVAKKTYASTVGNLTTLFAPSLRNSLEDSLVYNLGNEDTASFDSSTADGFGVGVYGIDNSGLTSSVTWSMNVGSIRKANILVYGSSGSSASADILVNGEVVKSFNPTKLNFSTINHYAIVEFDLPQAVNTATSVDVTLRNNDTASKKLYFSCCNFMWLKNYDGRDIDFYKVFTTSSEWIDAGGSSDYALYDTDLGKWCGSYHGGETRETAKITWTTGVSWRPVNQWNEGRYLLTDKSSVSAGWLVLPSFKIFQVTNINNKGKMLSIYNFDVDGTVEMDFSFYDGTINVNNFFTALTATHVDFGYVKYPRYEALPVGTTPLYFSPNDGHIQQYNLTANLTLGIRFTRFLSDYQAALKKNGWIFNDASFYKKFYYGYIDDYTGSVLVNNLQFKKCLDFMYE